ncbi:MAG: glycosyltransferase family 39 protein [Candidatus Woesearchaeota archaeon]
MLFSHRVFVALLCIVFASAIFRFVMLGGTDFFFDESLTAHSGSILAFQGINPWDFYKGEQPPVFAWLNAISLHFLGFSEFSVRLASAVLGVFTVVLVFLLARLYYGNKVALFAASIIAVMPLHVIYSRFAYSDIALTFFVLLAIFLSEFSLRRKSTVIAALSGVSFILAFFTKYNAVVLWALYWIFLFFYHRKQFPWFNALVANGSAVLASVVILQFKIRYFFMLGYNVAMWSYLQSLIVERPFYYYFSVLFDGLSPLLFGLFFFLLLFWIFRRNKKQTRRDLLVVFLVVAYLIIVFVQGRKYPRHLLMILPFVSIFVGMVINLNKKVISGILLLLVLVSCTFFSVYWIGRLNNFHMLSSTGSYLEANLPENATVHVAWNTVWPLKYYMGDEFALYKWGQPYERGAIIHPLINDRISAGALKQGDFVLVPNFNNHVTGNSPLEDNIAFFHSNYEPLPKGYLEFVTANSGLIATITHANTYAVRIYRITTPLNGTLEQVQEQKPAGLACWFKNHLNFIPKEFTALLSRC